MKKSKIETFVESIAVELFVLHLLEPIQVIAVSFKSPLNIQRNSFLVICRLNIVNQHSNVFSQFKRRKFVKADIKKTQISNKIYFKLLKINVLLVLFIFL
jgi:hypothetical protein